VIVKPVTIWVAEFQLATALAPNPKPLSSIRVTVGAVT